VIGVEGGGRGLDMKLRRVGGTYKLQEPGRDGEFGRELEDREDLEGRWWSRGCSLERRNVAVGETSAVRWWCSRAVMSEEQPGGRQVR